MISVLCKFWAEDSTGSCELITVAHQVGEGETVEALLRRVLQEHGHAAWVELRIAKDAPMKVDPKFVY